MSAITLPHIPVGTQTRAVGETKENPIDRFQRLYIEPSDTPTIDHVRVQYKWKHMLIDDQAKLFEYKINGQWVQFENLYVQTIDPIAPNDDTPLPLIPPYEG